MQQTSRVARNSEERGGGGGFADFVGVFCLRNHSRNSRNKSNQSECSTAHVCLQSLSANLINWRMDFYFPVRCLGFNLSAPEPRSLGEMTHVDFLRRIISRVRARQTSVCGAEKWDKAHKHTRSLARDQWTSNVCSAAAARVYTHHLLIRKHKSAQATRKL